MPITIGSKKNEKFGCVSWQCPWQLAKTVRGMENRFQKKMSAKVKAIPFFKPLFLCIIFKYYLERTDCPFKEGPRPGGG